MNENVTPATPARVAEVRAELAATQATLCHHHINRSRATCEPCDRADKPAPTHQEEAHA